MEREEIEALLSERLEALKTEMAESNTSALQGFASKMTREIKGIKTSLTPPKDEKPTDGKDAKPADDNSKDSVALQAVQSQLAELQSQLETERQNSFKASSRSALTDQLVAAKAENVPVLSEYLGNKFSLTQENGAWYVKDGDSVKTLGNAISSFLSTDEGKYFVAPSKTTGAGSSESPPATPTTNSPPSTAQALVESFSNI